MFVLNFTVNATEISIYELSQIKENNSDGDKIKTEIIEEVINRENYEDNNKVEDYIEEIEEIDENKDIINDEEVTKDEEIINNKETKKEDIQPLILESGEKFDVEIKKGQTAQFTIKQDNTWFYADTNIGINDTSICYDSVVNEYG